VAAVEVAAGWNHRRKPSVAMLKKKEPVTTEGAGTRSYVPYFWNIGCKIGVAGCLLIPGETGSLGRSRPAAETGLCDGMIQSHSIFIGWTQTPRNLREFVLGSTAFLRHEVMGV
jgi:hypothetical protein